MSPLELGGLIAVVTIVILATGIPIAFGLGLVAVAFLVAVDGWNSIGVMADTFYGGLADFTLVSIPMFVLMGAAVASSPAGKDLFEALERSVPAWIRPPKDERGDRLSGSARAFYETIDGRRTVGELLAVDDRVERAHRMDRLVLLLRDGAIALLPLPVEELGEVIEASGSGGAASWWRRLKATICE